MVGIRFFTTNILQTIKIIITVIVLFCVFTACNSKVNNDLSISEPLQIAYTENWLDFALKNDFAGYSVGQKLQGKFDSKLKGYKSNAYVLVSPIDDDVLCHDVLIAIETEKQVYVVPQPSSVPSYSDSIYACDVDGDNIDEVVIQQTIGMTGGAGQYLSRVYKIENNKIVTLFSSSPKEMFDTGFEFVAKNEYKLQVQNRLTSFKQIYDIKEFDNIVLALYNKDGTRNQTDTSIYVDSFLSFLPKDVDSDGVFELECKQYVAIYDHSNFSGYAQTVLKYNRSAKSFEIIEANFVQPV